MPAISSPCASCNFRRGCLPRLLGKEHGEHPERLVHMHRSVRTAEALFHEGDAFRSVYVVFGGSFKASATSARAGTRTQVTGFFLPGEPLGLTGFASGRYEVSAVALEDSSVCVLPRARIERIGHELPAVQRGLHAALGQAIVREQEMMVLLGTASAEQRLATLLLDLSVRFARHGYSAHEFLLRMTREDIGSYLGISGETVSRLFAGLREAGVLEVQYRRLRILDMAALRSLAHGARASAEPAVAARRAAPMEA